MSLAFITNQYKQHAVLKRLTIAIGCSCLGL